MNDQLCPTCVSYLCFSNSDLQIKNLTIYYHHFTCFMLYNIISHKISVKK